MCSLLGEGRVSIPHHATGFFVHWSSLADVGVSAEPIPDLTPMLKPSTLGDFAAYTLFAIGGTFFGGELGLLTGSASASSAVSRDPESKKRIEAAFKKFRAEVLRAEAASLEKGEGNLMGSRL